MTKQYVWRELLWLAGILVVSYPLMLAIGHLIDRLPLLLHAWQQVLPPPRYRVWLLYGLVVVGCYLGRLAAAGAGRIAAVPLRQHI